MLLLLDVRLCNVAFVVNTALNRAEVPSADLSNAGDNAPSLCIAVHGIWGS